MTDNRDRSKLRRLPERGSHDQAVIAAILDAAFLAHIGFAVDGQPFVIPTLFGRDGWKLYLHGSAASRLMRQLSTGIPACATVTLVDGLVLARSAFHHSINYRSVVAFGTAQEIGDPEKKNAALQVISEHLIAGRWAEVRPPNERELMATSVLEFSIQEASAKTRLGPPKDEVDDYDWPVWAGVVPLEVAWREPITETSSRAEPAYIRRSEKSRNSLTENGLRNPG